MKRITLMLGCVLAYITAWPQADSAKLPKKADTIRVGGMIIIKRGDGAETRNRTSITLGNKRKRKQSNISTAHWIVDLGFTNYDDKTDYAGATSQNYLINRQGSSPLSKNDLKLITGKSSNVNIWVFMQRINLIKQVVNLKYGLGVELNNYRYKSSVSFSEGGTNPYNPSQNILHPFVFRDSVTFTKNKLALDYATIPFMLNFRSNPNHSEKGLSLSAGISVGYLYSSRTKQKSGERSKQKNNGDFDAKNWKFSYVGELGLGPARLYGSYTPESIFNNQFNLTPYSVGIRFSNW